MTAIKERGRKLVSIALSVLLAGLLLPAYSPAVGHAAESVPALTLSANWFDGEEETFNSFTQEKPLQALFASNDAKVVKPKANVYTYGEGGNADLTAAIDGVIAQNGGTEGSATEVKVEWQSFDESDVTSADEKTLKVSKKEDGSWAFVANKATDASGVAVNVNITKATVKGSFSYEKPAAESDSTAETAQATFEGVVLNGINAKATYPVVVNDAFELDKKAVADSLSDEFSATYGDSTQVKSVNNLKYGSYEAEIVNDEQDSFDASAAVTSNKVEVSVTPKNATTAAKTATLKLTAKGGKTWEQPITVSIAKKQISFNDQSQAYRLQADQLEHAKSALQAEASGQMVGSDSANAVVSLGNAAFQAYPAEEGGTVTLSGIALGTDSSAANYALSNSSISVTVAPVEQVASDKADGFTVSGKRGNGEEVSIPQNGEEVWVAADPSAKWNGYTVASTLTGDYGEALALDATAKGVYSNQFLYGKNNDGVISKVTGISYRLDPDAPRIKSFATEQQPKSIFSGNWFFQDKADVDIAVTDEIGVDQFNQDVANPGVSGLSSDGAKVTYRDDHGNADHETSDFNNNGATGFFKFTIDGDQDVATKSFTATVTDNAGNTMVADSKDALQIPDEIMRLIADAAAPELTMTFDNNNVANGKYYKAPRTATITIKEAHFDYVQQYDPSQAIVKIVENGQARYLTPDSFKKIADDTWQVSVQFANNSDYEVYAQATDLVGKSSGVKSDVFTVDTVAPALSVSFDNENASNGMYFNAARTATVTVVEHNFSEGLFNIAPTSNGGNGSEVGYASVSGWTSYGDTHIARVTFPGQGVYSLAVSGQDLATNQATPYTCPEFVVDTVKPTIGITVGGQADASAHAYGKDAAMEVTVDDTNVSAASTVDLQAIGLGTSADSYLQNRTDSATKITVSAASPEEKPECDGVYRLTVNAIDLAGNTDTKTVDWSVNRFGSTYVLSDSTKDMVAKQYLTDDALNDVAVTEINPSGVAAESVSVQVAKGTSNSVLANGSDFTFGSAGESNGWPAYSYVISRDNYKSDAMYQTVLHSQDSAGHTAENTMAAKNEDRSASADIAFAVDNTAPIVSFSGFDESVVADSSHAVGVRIEDNLMLDHAVVKVNGETKLELDRDALATNDHEVVLGENSQDQRVTVEAYDAAGNMEPATSDSIFVNSDPIARWMHNTVLFVVSILAVVALLGLGGWALYRRSLKKREEN